MVIQQRVYSITPAPNAGAGGRLTQHLLNRRRHRWLKWHAWVIHEVSVFPVDAAVAELAFTGAVSWIVFAAMRDADMWGQSWTSRWFDPSGGVSSEAGSLPDNPSLWAGLLQYARQRTQVVSSAAGEAIASTRHAWTSFPRVVAADSVLFQYGTTVSNVGSRPQADVVVRYENITLPGWAAWEEAVRNTMGRQTEGLNP